MRMEFGWGRVTQITLALLALSSNPAFAQTRGNAACPGEDVFFDPGNGEDIALPRGYKASVFVKGLNFPTGIAFRGNRENFQVFVIESGTGLPSRCNDNSRPPFVRTSKDNPFTPDLLVFNQNGKQVAGPIGKPTGTSPAFQADGPAIGLAFEKGFGGGTLFATDSNQGARGARGVGNNTSRVVTVDIGANKVNPFITGLPTGDHPTELIVVKDGFIYWSQGSATNAGVTGHDNGAGGNQHDIACQDITLSKNVFDSGDGHFTSGYSDHGTARPGAQVKAFEGATKHGMCTGAILRARINSSHPENTVEPFSWGYRNPFGLRFAPEDHPLKGGLFVTENGEDERGARPTNNSPDRLQFAQQNRDGTPDFHGWPDRFGFLDSTQAIFNPKGGPGDDLPTARVIAEDTPVRHVLAFNPQLPVAPLAIEPTDVAVVGPDFAPDSFTSEVVHRGAALVAREGDFGFSPGNGEPEEGHDIQLVNFSKQGDPLVLELIRFAFNCSKANQGHNPDGTAKCTDAKGEDASGDQAFVSKIHGINRPLQVQFGPDGALYLVDYGAVRDFGASDPASKFTNPADAPLLQIPGTGVIWKITHTGGDDDRGDD